MGFCGEGYWAGSGSGRGWGGITSYHPATTAASTSPPEGDCTPPLHRGRARTRLDLWMCGIAGIRGLVMDKGAEQDQINNAKAVVHSGLERPEPIQSHSPVHGILRGRAPVNPDAVRMQGKASPHLSSRLLHRCLFAAADKLQGAPGN